MCLYRFGIQSGNRWREKEGWGVERGKGRGRDGSEPSYLTRFQILIRICFSILLQSIHQLMSHPSSLLPLKFGNAFALRSLSWEDFPGEVEVRMPWSAHIYWSIDYRITDPQKGKLTVNLVIAKRSWVREEKKCDHLLGHEQGHYLIGGLCALEFLRRVDSKKGHSMEKFQDMVLGTFNRTMAEFLEMERRYDNETQHRLNFKMQEKWDQMMFEKLTFYQQIYDKKKGAFVKLSESPSKGK